MKKFVYLLFWLLNFLLTPSFIILFVTGPILFNAISKDWGNKAIIDDGLLISILFVFWLLYTVSKLFIFPLIYKFSKNNPYIRNFFERIRKEKCFRNKVLLFAFLADVASIYVRSDSSFSSFSEYLKTFAFMSLAGAGGVFICYLSLIVWFKIKRY